jgi:hypothetical protein
MSNFALSAFQRLEQESANVSMMYDEPAALPAFLLHLQLHPYLFETDK